MNVDLLLVPYDSARRSERMGAGPDALVGAGLQTQLEQRGHHVRRAAIEPPAGSWRAEIRTAFELAANLAAAVRAARAARRFPLVLAGNCSAALGVVSGLGAGTRVLWADAHADFNTPETTVGGFLDGMVLATLTGRCWTALAATIPGFAPVPEDNVWLLGARDLDPAEAEALGRSAIRRMPAAALGAQAAATVAPELGEGAPLYLHLDLDVLDPSDGRANGYAAPGGVSAVALAEFCAALAKHASPAAATLSAYDPAVDADGRACRAALHAVDVLLGDARHHSAFSGP
jgi:arginase